MGTEFCHSDDAGIILLAWLWISPSLAKHVHPTREDNLLVCSSFTDASYMMVQQPIWHTISFVYIDQITFGRVSSLGFRLSDPADPVVHRLRRHDTQDPGGLQRVEIHRFHDVHDVRHLAGLRAHLLQVCARPLLFLFLVNLVNCLLFFRLLRSTASHLPLRITSMSVTISLSATVTLACLFSPKLYIIIVHPERNVRQV